MKTNVCQQLVVEKHKSKLGTSSKYLGCVKIEKENFKRAKRHCLNFDDNQNPAELKQQLYFVH
jgi:hypothetical protein